MQLCKYCNKERQLTEFRKNRRRCKPCERKFNREYGGFIDPGSYCFSADDLHYLGDKGEGDTEELIDNTPFETSDNYFIFDVKSTHTLSPTASPTSSPTTISQYVSIELKQFKVLV